MSYAQSRGTKATNDSQPVPGTRNGTLRSADEITTSSSIVNFLGIATAKLFNFSIYIQSCGFLIVLHQPGP